jgi:hypothetical protein
MTHRHGGCCKAKTSWVRSSRGSQTAKRKSSSKRSVLCGAFLCCVSALECPEMLARNLCIDGGYDICSEMYNKNILIPLKTFVSKVRGPSLVLLFGIEGSNLGGCQISHTLAQYLDSPKTAPEKMKRLVYEFADNVITTLWCLSCVSTSHRGVAD